MMKKVIFSLLITIIGVVVSCTSDDKDMHGSIYGVVSDSQTAEPLRAIGVELYRYDMLLLKTVTYDDGHFEFENLEPDSYVLKIVADGYDNSDYTVLVEPGRTARADMQALKLSTNMTVTTLEVDGPTDKKITFNGKYVNSYSYAPNEVGFIYAQVQTLDENNGTIIKTENDNTFKCTINAQELANGKWYVRAYAKNKIGYEFGQIRMFEVNLVPEVKTLATTNIEETTATLNGLIVYEGNPKYTEKGFVYSSSFQNPTLDDPDNATKRVSISGNSNEFSANISELTKNKTYYVRAYAKCIDAIVYGDAVTFMPSSKKPEVTTLNVTNIEGTTATFNGLIVNEGKPKYTEKGFVYSTSFQTPTIDDPDNATKKVSVSGSSHEFSYNVSNLTIDKTYYVRAYAKCSDGIVYGEVVSFTASEKKPYIIIDGLAVQLSDLSGASTWSAAKDLCSKSRIGGFSDWRLPTVGELKVLYKNREKIGGFVSEIYWSSTYDHLYSNYKCYKTIYFVDGYEGWSAEYYEYRVRAVRSVN